MVKHFADSERTRARGFTLGMGRVCWRQRLHAFRGGLSCPLRSTPTEDGVAACEIRPCQMAMGTLPPASGQPALGQPAKHPDFADGMFAQDAALSGPACLLLIKPANSASYAARRPFARPLPSTFRPCASSGPLSLSDLRLAWQWLRAGPPNNYGTGRDKPIPFPG
jgi:hypothetical protein